MNYRGSNILIPMESRHIDHAKFADLQQALLNSFRASSQQEINEASYLISCHQRQEGYVTYIIEIINHALSLPHSEDGERLVSCALTQLKVFLRKFWRQLNPADKQYLVGSLVRTNINVCSISNVRHQAGCMKLLKDVVQITNTESINTHGEVIATIEANLYSPQCVNVLPACLNIILGAVNNISLLVQMEFSQKAISILERLHPLLMDFTSWGEKHIHSLYQQLVGQQGERNVSQQQYLQFKRKYEEVLYLNIKLLYKILSLKKTETIEHIFLAWIPIIINRVAFIDPSFTSPEQRDLDMGLRGTDHFNYYHGKKWALKLLRKIMDRILVYKSRQSSKAIRVIRFYQENLQRLVELFREAWQHQWPQKIKFQLLRTMERLIECQPLLLVKHFQEDLRYYQEVLLPPMIVFSTEADILVENPSEFLYREQMLCDKSTSQLQSCRLTAARVWLAIAGIDFRYNPACDESKMLMASVLQLQGYLHLDENQNMQVRDTGCFLLVKLNKRLRQNDKVKRTLGMAVSRIIIQNLQLSENGHFILLVRAFELAGVYSELIDDRTKRVVQERVLAIFRQIDLNSPITYDVTAVLQRGSIILSKLVVSQSQRDIHMSTDDAKMVISVLFTIVRSTSNEDFIDLVSEFLSACMRYLGSCYKEIALFLQGWFIQYVEMDMELYLTAAARDYKRSYHDIALGTISIYETILTHMDQKDEEIVKVLDDEVSRIVTYILSLNQYQGELLEKGIELLSTYLQVRDAQHVNASIIKLCRLIILRIAGLPPKLLSKLKHIPSSSPEGTRWIGMLLNCQERLIQGLNNYVAIVRLFIKHLPFGEEVRGFREINDGILEKATKDTEYLIYLSNRYYASTEPSEYGVTYNGKCFSLLSLMHYYEHHQRKECTARIHPSVNQFVFNLMLQVTREYIVKRGFAKYNAQLFCLWIHEVQESFVHYTQGISMQELSQFFTNVLIFQKHFGLRQLYHFEQAVRCTFGLSSFIRLGLKFNDLWLLLPVELWVAMIAASIRFAYKSTEAYADEDKEDSVILNSDDQWGEDEKNEEEEGPASPSEQTEPDMHENPCITQVVNAPQKIHSHESEEELNEESEGWESDSEEGEDCLDYQQADDHMTPSPLEEHDDSLYLLETLYALSHSKRALYRQIITEKHLEVKIDAIIHSADCHCLPDRKHFYTLSPDHWQN